MIHYLQWDIWDGDLFLFSTNSSAEAMDYWEAGYKVIQVDND